MSRAGLLRIEYCHVAQLSALPDWRRYWTPTLVVAGGVPEQFVGVKN